MFYVTDDEWVFKYDLLINEKLNEIKEQILDTQDLRMCELDEVGGKPFRKNDILLDEFIIRNVIYTNKIPVYDHDNYYMTSLYRVVFSLCKMPLLYKILAQVEKENLNALKQLSSYLNGEYPETEIKLFEDFKEAILKNISVQELEKISVSQLNCVVDNSHCINSFFKQEIINGDTENLSKICQPITKSDIKIFELKK